MGCKEQGEVIETVEFADWGLPYARGGSRDDPFTPGNCEAFSVNTSCTFNDGRTLAYVKSICEGKSSCNVDAKLVKRYVGDPCSGIHKRIAIRASGCSPAQNPQPSSSRVNFKRSAHPLGFRPRCFRSSPPHSLHRGLSDGGRRRGCRRLVLLSPKRDTLHTPGGQWLQPSRRHWQHRGGSS